MTARELAGPGHQVATAAPCVAPRKPGRPRGELQRVIAEAAAAAPGTVRELAKRTQVGHKAASHTVQNMLRRGDLVAVAWVLLPGTSRRVQVFGPPAAARPGQAPAAGTDALAQALAGWRRPGE